MSFPSVFLLLHVRQDEVDEDVKAIGIYSSHEHASAAVERLKALPGFRDYPKGFCIDEYEVDKDHWVEGFGFD